jgi:hemerythrin-like domain-containing protein
MDILEKLHEEHEEVKALLSQMVETESGSRRGTLFKKFKPAMVKHSRAEEKALYNPLKKSGEEEAGVEAREGFVEHHLVDTLISKFGRLRDKGSEDASAIIKVIKDLVEHHVEEEESNVWQEARELFSDEDREAMYEKFEAEKKKVKVKA